jgi:hypothetical protein
VEIPVDLEDFWHNLPTQEPEIRSLVSYWLASQKRYIQKQVIVYFVHFVLLLIVKYLAAEDTIRNQIYSFSNIEKMQN